MSKTRTAPVGDSRLFNAAADHLELLSKTQAKIMARLVQLFIYLNLFVFVLVLLCLAVDVLRPEKTPLVSSNVLMVFIGASAVQLGGFVGRLGSGLTASSKLAIDLIKKH